MENLENDTISAIGLLEDEIKLCVGDDYFTEETLLIKQKLDADLQLVDIAFCIVCTVISVFITTSKDFEKWLEGIHDVANEQGGQHDILQKILGKTLYHKGDAMDRFATRDGDDPYRLYHRLFWGHDIIGKGGDICDNPFFLMYKQEVNGKKLGMMGILQAVRHLIADTFSKQGVPMPGSSYFDYTNENGRPWNKIVDFVQELSQEAYGNKQMAESIYEHIFTIRAQDVIGGMFSKVASDVYVKCLKIEDEIRVAQIKLLNTTMSFVAQAIVGMVKQKGVPYINTPLGLEMTKNMASLLIKSNIKTNRLQKKTNELLEDSDRVLDSHDRLMDLVDGKINIVSEREDDNA